MAKRKCIEVIPDHLGKVSIKQAGEEKKWNMMDNIHKINENFVCPQISLFFFFLKKKRKKERKKIHW